MKKLKICFVGVGSIAKRHIRNLRSIQNERGIEFQIDALRRTEGIIPGIDSVYNDPDSISDDYDVVFITNPTELHLESLKMLHEKSHHFFIEKPVVSLTQLNEARRFKTREESVYYIASPLRYNAVIQWIQENINPVEVVSVRSISSSYLPDWRPGQDYRETYSAHRNMGGGVSIDLIHEWDYLTYLFGWPKRIQSFIGKKSGLEIDSDDYAIYIAEYANMITEVHLDYFGRKTIREIQLLTKDETIIGDLVNNEIRLLVKEEKISFNEKRDDYQKRELLHFLDMISDKTLKANSYYSAIDLLELTQGMI